MLQIEIYSQLDWFKRLCEHWAKELVAEVVKALGQRIGGNSWESTGPKT
jgi:hypothetical protein